MEEPSFKLDIGFLNRFSSAQPDWGPLGYFTYMRTYSRPRPNGENEQFWQTLERVVNGTFEIQRRHCAQLRLPWSYTKAQKSAQEMYTRMWDFKFLPPGRGLWAMGTDYLWHAGSACLNNCGFVSTKNIDTDFAGPFVWLMQMSMLGVGVGFDTLGAGKARVLTPSVNLDDVYVVEDSREGWCSALEHLLGAFDGQHRLGSFDLSQIRPIGVPIKGFGGFAPGPEPLRDLLDNVRAVLSHRNNGSLTSTDIVDIMNYIGASVVAGGVRRSSEIALGTYEDKDFLHLKDPQHLSNPALSRWASNNSIVIDNPYSANYEKISEGIQLSGEPGVFWIENARHYGRMCDPPGAHDVRVMGTNPCGEQSLESFELCNLVETFPSLHETEEDYLETLKYAYMYAKTVTLLPTQDERTNAVMMRNRRIGLSQTGIVEAIEQFGWRSYQTMCETAYEKVREWDDIYSGWLCVPKSIKVTTVKPSGTVSLLPGVTPGMHHSHAEFYIRRVRVSASSDLWRQMEEAGYPVEPCVNQPDMTMVISFPVMEEGFVRRKDEVSMWEQLELAAQLQNFWSDNQVSATVTFTRCSEGSDIARALEMYSGRLKSISFLPLEDHPYEQAPYEEISEGEFNRMSNAIQPVNLMITEKDRKLEQFCDGDSCEVPL